MHKSVAVLVLISFGTLIFHAGIVHAPSGTVLEVVNMGNADAPSRWTAGTPRWIGTNTFLFYTNETANGDTFYVGMKVYDVVDLYAWTFKLWFNATLLNCTSVWRPGYWIFAGLPYYAPWPIINNTEGYVSYDSSLLAGPGFSGSGTLCQIGFQIRKEPTVESALLECDFTLDLSDTYFVDSNLEIIETQLIPGHYEYMYAQPDISIRKLEAAKTVVGEGYSTKIDVAVANQGSNTENFSLTVYADTNVVGFIEDVMLASGSSSTVTLNWNTIGFAKGNYTLKAHATPVLGEINLADNNLTDGWVIIAMVGDITGPDGWPDGKCDMRDIAEVAQLFGRTPIWPQWNPNCDITGVVIIDGQVIVGVPDEKIDMRDIALVARHFGETDP